MGKKILITGANSYIGTSVERWLEQWPDAYEVHALDMVDESWKKSDFSLYEVVFHVAGIAHADIGHVSEEQKAFYYKINTDLAIETARKACEDGVKQFIFMSSMIVYGDSAPIGVQRIISANELPCPANFYGDSKLQAEKGIYKLKKEDFKVVILRPPMIYGKGSKGNYPMLSRLAKKLPIFPYIQNERSMLHIENLCEFVRLMIDYEEDGVYFPQNEEYVQTSQLIKLIGEVKGKKIRLVKCFNPCIWILSKIPGRIGKMTNKAFGNLVYEKSMSNYKINYRINSLKASVYKTESGNE